MIYVKHGAGNALETGWICFKATFPSTISSFVGLMFQEMLVTLLLGVAIYPLTPDITIMILT